MHMLGKKGVTSLGAQGQEGGGKASLSAQGSNAVVLLMKSQFRFRNTKAFDIVAREMVP